MEELTPRDPERGRRLFRVGERQRKDPAFGSWKRVIIKAENYSFDDKRSEIRDAYKIDPRWLDFSTFRHDMGPKPPDTWLDRIDRFKPFSKKNCRWSTRQNLNRLHDDTEFFDFKIEEEVKPAKMRKTKTQWSRLLNVPINQIRYQAKKGTLPEFIEQRMKALLDGLK